MTNRAAGRSVAVSGAPRVAGLVAIVLSLATPAARAVVYDPSQSAAPGATTDAGVTASTPQAQQTLDAGLAALREAEALDAATPPNKKAKAPSPALKDAYVRARTQFLLLTQSDPNLALAWNGLGYSQRKLGDYDSALASYDRAIELKPGYPEATEYRGEAFLGLGRVNDAKQAYLDLFATSRPLADRLLVAMKRWIDGQKKGSPDAADLSTWVAERSQIAAQTASLTRNSLAPPSHW